MENYTKYIGSVIAKEPENILFEISDIYEKYFCHIPKSAYFKAIERLKNQGVLIHLTNGVYYKPQKSRFGVIPIGENDIISHYTKEKQGIVIGYRLYNHKGLTTQISKRAEILSTIVSEQKKNVGNVLIKKCKIAFNNETIPVIETLEILQNYGNIEDLNKSAFATYMKNYVAEYSDSAAVFVLKNRKYKKSTIAFLERFLEYFNVKNTLNQFLSNFSTYKIPQMEEFYESART